MKVYKDLISGDELCSDSYMQSAPFDDPELLEVAFEVKSRLIAKTDEDFGIADNSEMEDGEGGSGLNPDIPRVVDIIDAFQLHPTGFSKKDFSVYIKGFMMRVKKHLEEKNVERVPIFTQGAQKLVKKMLSQFDELSFHLGDSMNDEGLVVFSYYKGEEESPRFIYLKDALKEEKY